MFQSIRVVFAIMIMAVVMVMPVQASEKGSHMDASMGEMKEGAQEMVESMGDKAEGLIDEMIPGSGEVEMVQDAEEILAAGVAEVNDGVEAPEPPEMSSSMTYEIDNSHTQLGFAVKHLAISTTRGQFTDYVGSITYSPDSVFEADVTIQTASIDTHNKGRDDHLRGPDFFDAEAHPTITFKSNTLEKRGEGQVIVGDLTIKGVTKTVTIPVQVTGPVTSPFGGDVIGLAGTARINRQEYNVSWSKNLDSGGLVVDDWVDLNIEIEAMKK